MRCLDGRDTPYPAHHALLNLSSSDTGVRRTPLVAPHAPAFPSVCHCLDVLSRADTHALALCLTTDISISINRYRPQVGSCA